MPCLDLKLDLQLEAAGQQAHELAQMKDALIRREPMSNNAEHSTNLTDAFITAPAMLPSVQTGNTSQHCDVSDWAASVVA